MYTQKKALELAHYSQIAYSDYSDITKDIMQHGKYLTWQYYDREGTQAVAIINGNSLNIAFRGTETDSLKDIMLDVNCKKVSTHHGEITRGFQKAYNNIKEEIEALITSFNGEVWLTGHSLGAAVATVCASDIVNAGGRIAGLYTFGSPRVGNQEFCDFLANSGTRIYRFVNNCDIVTRIPLSVLGFLHVGEIIYIDHEGKIHTDSIGLWNTFWDRYQGRKDDIWERKIGGISDHSMENYTKAIEAGTR